jgi:ABC-2 type transport system permease protein/lipopolysaccharide transport system permease protein
MRRTPDEAELPAPPSAAAQALADLIDGASRSWMWWAMAMQDIRLRYRGSVLGPLWLTISTAVMVTAIGLIYSRLFKMQVQQYLPFLTTGLVIWHFLAGAMTEGCDTFLSSRTVIQQLKLPFTVYACRTVCRNLIVLAHNMLIVPVVLVMFDVTVGWPVLAIVPALILLFVNGVWVALLLGMLSARYRDVPPIVASVVQILFFITPVFWPPEALGDGAAFLPLNPLFAALDVIRAPLLGAAPMPWSWPVLLAVSAAGAAFSFIVFVRFRARIAYWV